MTVLGVMRPGDIVQRVGHPEIVAQVLPWGGARDIVRLVRLEMRDGVPKYGAGEPFKGQAKDWVAWAPSSDSKPGADQGAPGGGPEPETASEGCCGPGAGVSR